MWLGHCRAGRRCRPPDSLDRTGRADGHHEGMSNTPPSPRLSCIKIPVPEVYQGVSIQGIERPARFAFGEEGKITFQPGRFRLDSSPPVSAMAAAHGSKPCPSSDARSDRRISTQPILNAISYSAHLTTAAPSSMPALPSSEHHLLLDFSVGKDVGIGLLGRDGHVDAQRGRAALGYFRTACRERSMPGRT